jgi:rhodanese-related sulfurtransferase
VDASLRAINLGYTNVLSYRGGIESWKKAGLPVQSAGTSQNSAH